jgi:hypothetical protein
MAVNVKPLPLLVKRERDEKLDFQANIDYDSFILFSEVIFIMHLFTAKVLLS